MRPEKDPYNPSKRRLRRELGRPWELVETPGPRLPSDGRLEKPLGNLSIAGAGSPPDERLEHGYL